jgi:hypothetical protein
MLLDGTARVPIVCAPIQAAHMRHLLIVPLLAGCVGNAQYNGPESVEYDPVGDRYFVSCTGSNSIKQRAHDGTVTDFVTGISEAPYGIELKGDTLFACVGGNIKGYLTSSGAEVFDLDLSAVFLNGLACDGHFLYATDFNDYVILKVDPDQGSFNTLVPSTAQKPNGIVYDPALNKLWVAFWGSGARIRSYDRDSGAELSSYTTSLTNIDGITLDCNGNILVASWSPARITRFEPTFTQPAETVISSGLNNPADIAMDAQHGLVCIPNAGNNTVVLPELPGCENGVPDELSYRTINAFPNPTDGLVRVDLALEKPEPFMVLTKTGLLVASGTLKQGGLLNISSLAAGTYLFDFPGLKRYVRVVKD